MSQGHAQQEDRGQEAERVGDVDGLEGDRPVDVDHETADDAAQADAEVEQREVHPEVALPEIGRDDRRDQALDRRPLDAEGDPLQGHRDHRDRKVRGEGEGHVGHHLEAHREEHDHARAVRVDDGTARPHRHEAHQRGEPDQQADVTEGEATDLVEVDHEERAAPARCRGTARPRWTAASGPRAGGRTRRSAGWRGRSSASLTSPETLPGTTDSAHLGFRRGPTTGRQRRRRPSSTPSHPRCPLDVDGKHVPASTRQRPLRGGSGPSGGPRPPPCSPARMTA